MLALLRRRPEFRRLFAAHAVSRAGDAFNTVALVVLVFQLTGSGAGVAGTVAFEIAPFLLLGPVAGLVVDRRPPRNVMVAADLGRALLAGVLALSHGSVGLAYFVAFGLSTGSLLFNPAASSLVPDTVDGGELVEANAGLWSVAVVAQILLAPTAGLVIAAFGVGPAFAVNAASYVVSAALLWRLPVPAPVPAVGEPAPVPAEPAPATRGWHGVWAGAHAVRADPLLTRLAVVQVLAALSAGATSGLLVVLAGDWLDVGPSGFGGLLGAIGVGAAGGPLLLRRRIRPGHPGWLFGPYALRGCVDLVLAAVSTPLVAGGGLLLYGVGTSTGMVAYQSTLQTAVPAAVRGRAFAFYDVTWNAGRLVSLGLGGLLAEAIGIRAVYIVGGLLLMAAAGVGLGPWPGRNRVGVEDPPPVSAPPVSRQ
ncbi:MAG TPA: MFS transporter [Acidimicrobiales bacterium]|nr:MFS transporter [Acidimicrobiales bacterium]